MNFIGQTLDGKGQPARHTLRGKSNPCFANYHKAAARNAVSKANLVRKACLARVISFRRH